MLTLITQVLLLYALSWTLWWFTRRVLLKTDLDKLPGPISPSFLMGNLKQLFDHDGWSYHTTLAKRFGRVVKLWGLLGSRRLYVFDPKALHHIVVKEQDIFEETDAFFMSNRISFGEGLLATFGERHRKQRRMLNPVFSIAHMRNMIPIFYGVANKLEQAIKLKIAQGAQEIDLLHWMNRAALEMIGQSGLGYSFDTLEEGTDSHPFGKAVRDFVPTISKMGLPFPILLPIVGKVGTPRFRRYVVERVPWKKLQNLRDVIDTMDRTTREIFESKKKALREGDKALAMQIGEAKDLLSILMKANMEASQAEKLPDEEVLGQMTTLAFAATDTTSNALSRTLHLLSMHQEVQDKLREEVTEAQMAYGEIPYDVLVDKLPYLDAVCRETLRLYPPASTLLRTARKDVILPFSSPIKGTDGHEMDSVLVPRGTDVHISILNANRDPAPWSEDSYEWKPERWLSPLPQAVYNAHMPGIYSHLMTFLGGGRACIGFKFSQLEMSTGCSVLLDLAIPVFPIGKRNRLEIARNCISYGGRLATFKNAAKSGVSYSRSDGESMTRGLGILHEGKVRNRKQYDYNQAPYGRAIKYQKNGKKQLGAIKVLENTDVTANGMASWVAKNFVERLCV